MKLKLPSISKLPKMRIPKFQFPKKPVKRFNASARRAAPTMDDAEEDEPQAKLSTAFIIMLLVHVVAVVGVYAFNSIKANRRSAELAAATPAAKPSQKSNAAAAPAASTQTAQVMPVGGTRVHSVRPGESLMSIAKLYSVGMHDLAELNTLKDNAILRPGQALNIPATKLAMATAPARPLAESAREKPAAAKKADDPALKAAAAKAASPAASAPKTYTVAKGDNPHAIARKLKVSYDDLIKLNKIDDPTKLRIGTTLKVPVK